MIPEPTRQEHYHAMRNNPDAIGYCHQLFKDKTGKNITIGAFAKAMLLFIKTRNRKMGMLEGTEHIKDYFSKKFA